MRLGIDIGGTKIHAVAFDDSLRVVAEVRRGSGLGSGEVLENTRGAIRELEATTGTKRGGFESAGLGIPGLVDFERGIVSHAVNLRLEQLDLSGGLAAEVSGPVRVDNDVNVAALGVYQLLDARPASLAFLNVGTGLASGIVIDGRIWRGAGGNAGEIGHLVVEPGGRLCGCGQHGCLETVASGSAIAGSAPDGEVWTVRTLIDRAAAGDAHARAERARVVGGIATAVQALALALDPEVIVLGGGVINHGPGLVSAVPERLAEVSAGSLFVASLHLAERIRTVPHDSSGEEAPIAAIGAALLATT
jgi:predicted NBD/HSP70 family sugar kinase